MPALALPSHHLDTLVRELSPYCNGDEVVFPGEDFNSLVERLATIRKMMSIIEREVGALRLAEAARSGKAIVEDLATDQLKQLVEDPEGKVIRPNFGRRNDRA